MTQGDHEESALETARIAGHKAYYQAMSQKDDSGTALIAEKQAFARAYHEALLPGVVARVREEVFHQGAEAMREEIISKIYGYCDSDNAAQRTVNVVRKLSIKPKFNDVTALEYARLKSAFREAMKRYCHRLDVDDEIERILTECRNG